MHIITVDYIDYVNNDEKRREQMAFNLNAWELSELTVQFPEGIGEYMETALKEERAKDALAVLKLLFIHAYGRRQPRADDPKRYEFLKNPAWLMSLLPSPEFEAFYLMLSNDTKFATEFWNGIVTPELLKRALEIAEKEGKKAPEKTTLDLPLDEQIKRLMQQKAELEGKKPANEQ